MRRSASEIIRNLEMRVARLERQSSFTYSEAFSLIEKDVKSKLNWVAKDIEKALQKKYRYQGLEVRLDYYPNLIEVLTPERRKDFIMEVAVYDRRTKDDRRLKGEAAVKVQLEHLELPKTLKLRSEVYPKDWKHFEENRSYSGRRVNPRYVPPTEADIARNINNVDFGPEY
jgi:hypothetical protein